MAHEYGGIWTQKKLQVLQKYLRAYTTALKHAQFKLIYIDAFAGTGEWIPKAHDDIGGFFALEERTPSKGSAQIALELTRPFDRYVFIEKKTAHYRQLQSLNDKFPHLANRIEYENADANEAIQGLCRTIDWRRARAVLFLDPYGMQVDWTTIEAVARTCAIDMWYWVPTGMGIARVAKLDGELPEAWEACLDRMLGEKTWRTELYKTYPERSLFDDNVYTERRRVPLERIERYFLERLRTVFAAAEATRFSLEWDNSAMYMLVLAISNQKAKALAYKLAQIKS